MITIEQLPFEWWALFAFGFYATGRFFVRYVIDHAKARFRCPACGAWVCICPKLRVGTRRAPRSRGRLGPGAHLKPIKRARHADANMRGPIGG